MCSSELWVPGGPAAPQVRTIAMKVNVPGARLPERNTRTLPPLLMPSSDNYTSLLLAPRGLGPEGLHLPHCKRDFLSLVGKIESR